MTPTIAVRRWAASAAALGAYVPYAGAVAVTLAAPFEQLKPAIDLPVQKFTNVELVVLAALVSWTMWWLVTRERPQVRTALTAPVLLLLGTMALSALMAPDYRKEALSFTTRFAVGFLVYLLVVNSATGQRRLVGMLVAAGVAGTVVAGLGILEYWQVPAVMEWLKPFKVGQILVGGERRISSTLQYPTITSMYLELTFGFTLGLLLLAVGRRQWWAVVPAFVALGLMAQAIILTLSRSGLIVMAGMLVVVGGLWLLRQGIDRGFWVVLAVLAMIAGLLGNRLLNDSMLWLRLTTENDESWYRARYQVPTELELQTGQVHQVDMVLTNVGRATWRPGGDAPFRLSYHWLDSDTGEVVIFEGLRTELPHAVRPGQSVQLHARIQAPPQPGRYRLAWDVLQENRVWFSAKNSPGADSLVVVRGAAIGQPEPAPVSVIEPRLTLGRRTLWQLAGRMLATRPLLGVGPDNFRLLYGRYAGLERWDQGLHTNNMYVEFFVDMGLVGGVLFLWLLWRVLSTLRQGWRRVGLVGLPVFMGVAAAVAAFLLHGVVDYFFEFTSTYLMIWITLGIAVASRRLHYHKAEQTERQ
ncbi:MAG: O-antigen ligase family protein [Anaerolineae bacterium]